MITAKLVTTDGAIGESSIAGYDSLLEAEKALSEDWPMTSLFVSNALVLKDYDGCRLILQRA